MNREMRRKRRGFPVGAAVVVALLVSGSCKWGTPDYTLTVTLGPGIVGTPAAGKHVYKEMTTVVLNYSSSNTLETVEAFLNTTIREPGTGSFVMYADGYQLTADVIDVRTSYKVTMAYTDTTITAPDPFIITLTGPDRLSGTFTDTRGYHGTWTGSSNNLVLAYWDWSFYVLSVTVFNMGHSAGTFNGGGQSGVWTAIKQ